MLLENKNATSPLDVGAGAARTAATSATLIATLALPVGLWLVSVRHRDGMDMGVTTELGSFPSFVALWLTMMGAMMLPGATPAVLRRAHAGHRVGTVPLFVGSYLAVWTLVGVAVYALYRPHGTAVAGGFAIAAGIYEIAPLKRQSREHCRQGSHSGLEFGLSCVGSSIGLMLLFVALGVMSVLWMGVIALLIAAQKLLHPRAAIDVPVTLAILGLGVLILVAPSSLPGLTPPM
jgi:predicted metal-binding membrane protein